MSSLITIVTNERDFGADAVIRHLSSTGIEIRRLNFESAVAKRLPDWAMGYPEERRCHGVIWLRQFSAHYEPPKDLFEADERLVTRSQWRTWLSMLDGPSSIWVNPIWAARRAENKIEQLRVASRIGFSVPRTLITNSRDQARDFWQSSHEQVVVKSLSAAFFELSNQSFVFTEEASAQLFSCDREHAWNSQPVLMQHRIPADFDARLIVFGDFIAGARLSRDEGLTDWRTEADSSPWEPWDPPDHVKTLCQTYLRRMDLRYAAFDFLLERDTIWFLEANQAGEWHFLDRQLELGIDEALAQYLASLGRGP